jgi:hypothetical protein
VPLWWYALKFKKTRLTPFAISLFLFVLFILYLPLRFERRATPHEKTGVGAMMRGEARKAFYHEEGDGREGLAVNLTVAPAPIFAGTSTRLDFFVNQKPGSVPVTDLEIEHEKPMHVIGVRNDMEEFFHVHPQSAPSAPSFFSAAHVFAKPGFYKIWSEVKHEGINHAFGHPEIAVEGAGERYKKEIFFGRSVIVSNNYQALLHYDEPVVKGKTASLHFEIRDLFGREAMREPYLGADMHLALIRDNLKQFIHTHPVNDAIDGDHHATIIPAVLAHGVEEKAADGERKEIAFNVVFPEAGTYKAFAQFRPRGIGLPMDEALVASFWIRVDEKFPFRLSLSRSALSAISLLLIVVLSAAVKRYIAVKNYP